MGADRDLRRLEQRVGALTRTERERDFNRRAFCYALTVVMLVGIWGLTGAGYFWPGWVMLFGGLHVAKLAWVTWANPPLDDPDEV